jgi:hypothetical protein
MTRREAISMTMPEYPSMMSDLSNRRVQRARKLIADLGGIDVPSPQPATVAAAAAFPHGGAAFPHGGAAFPHGGAAFPHGGAAFPHGGAAFPQGRSE